MHGLLAPVMAQLVTLTLGDRVEAQYVISDQPAWFDSSNTATPGATLKLDWRRTQLTLGYAPTLTLAPLQESPRELLISHGAFIEGQYRWKRTTLILNQTASYGERDLRREALAGAAGAAPPGAQQNPPAQNPAQPTPGTGATPGTGGAVTPGVTDTPNAVTPALASLVRYGAFRSSGALEHSLSQALSVRLAGGYAVAGGMDRESQRALPLARGPDGSAAASYALDGRNSFTTTLTSQLIFNQNGSNAFLATAGEDYTHKFTPRTSTIVGAGVAFGRTEPANGLPLYSIYPTGRARVAHTSRLARGNLTVALGATTAPILDLRTAVVDPQLGFDTTAIWTRRRLSLTLTGAASVSMAPREPSSFASVQTGLVAGYDLGLGFRLDGGVRGVWQRYGRETLIQPSAVLFAALVWGAAIPLNPAH